MTHSLAPRWSEGVRVSWSGLPALALRKHSLAPREGGEGRGEGALRDARWITPG